VPLEKLYDKLAQHKQLRNEALKRGNMKVANYAKLKMLSIKKQIREEKEKTCRE